MQGLSSGDRIGLTDGVTNRYLRVNRTGLLPGFHGRLQRWGGVGGVGDSAAAESDSLHQLKHSRGLHSRLEELLVFVIDKEGGGSAYKRLTVRSLHKYVISAIKHTTKHLHTKQQHDGTPPTAAAGSGSDKHRRGISVDVASASMLLDQLALARAVVNAPPGGIRQAQRANFDYKGAVTHEHEGKIGDEAQIGTSVRSVEAAIAGAEVEATTNDNNNNANSNNNVTYRERLGGYLHPRDMRKLVTPFSASNEPEFIVRRHCILLNFDPLRAIILRDRLLVLVPDGADSILVELEKKIRGDTFDDGLDDDNDDDFNNNNGTTKSMTDNGPPSTRKDDVQSRATDESTWADNGSDNNGSGYSDVNVGNEEDIDAYAALVDNEWDELDRNEWADLPFELQCLDAVLSSVSTILADDVLDLQLAANRMIVEMLEPRSDVGDHAQEILRQMKNSTQEMTSRVEGFNRAIHTTLEDYEDMALMNLGRLITHPHRFIQPVLQSVLDEESDEPELILEAHLQRGHTLANALRLVQGQITSTEDFAERKSDTIRNRILYINMMLTTLALAVAIGSFVGSLFGMNTLNGYEDSTKAFLPIVFITLTFMVALVAVVFLVIWHLGALPRLL